MREFPIPVVPFGAGSHPVADEGFAFLPMPKAEPLLTPVPPPGADAAELAAAADVVEQLVESMSRGAPGSAAAARFSLRAMAPGALRVLNESLGQGEVSAVVAGSRGDTPWHIQETAFAGVWRVQRDDRLGFRADDLLESGDMPGVVRDAVRRVRGAPGGPELPRDVMNAPALLNEIRHHTAAFREGMAAHVVNLTLLPISPADHAALDAFLGEGAVSILSRGFGNCRISSTRLPHAWRVRYFNSMNTVILDTVEVVDLPEAARATEEDLAESIERLRELVAWMREP